MFQSVTEKTPLLATLNPTLPKEINSARRMQYLYAACQHTLTFVKVVAFAAAIFVVAGGFHHYMSADPTKIPVEILTVFGLGVLALMAGGYSERARQKKRAYKAYADNLTYISTGVAPQEQTSKVEKVVNRILNYIDCGVRSLFSHISSKPAVWIPSRNCGKWDDVPKNDAPIHAHTLPGIAKKHGIFVTPTTIETDPFSRGVCLGACFLFAKDYLAGNTIESVAEKFREGVPQEAVELQAMYMHMFWAASITPAEKRYQQKENATAECMGLEIYARQENLERYEAIEKLEGLAQGVYEITYPTLSARHATLLIKNGEGAFFFDPNFGTSCVHDLTKFMNEKLPAERDINISSLRLPNPGDATINLD